MVLDEVKARLMALDSELFPLKIVAVYAKGERGINSPHVHGTVDIHVGDWWRIVVSPAPSTGSPMWRPLVNGLQERHERAEFEYQQARIAATLQGKRAMRGPRVPGTLDALWRALVGRAILGDDVKSPGAQLKRVTGGYVVGDARVRKGGARGVRQRGAAPVWGEGWEVWGQCKVEPGAKGVEAMRGMDRPYGGWLVLDARAGVVWVMGVRGLPKTGPARGLVAAAMWYRDGPEPVVMGTRKDGAFIVDTDPEKGGVILGADQRRKRRSVPRGEWGRVTGEVGDECPTPSTRKRTIAFSLGGKYVPATEVTTRRWDSRLKKWRIKKKVMIGRHVVG